MLMRRPVLSVLNRRWARWLIAGLVLSALASWGVYWHRTALPRVDHHAALEQHRDTHAPFDPVRYAEWRRFVDLGDWDERQAIIDRAINRGIEAAVDAGHSRREIDVDRIRHRVPGRWRTPYEPLPWVIMEAPASRDPSAIRATTIAFEHSMIESTAVLVEAWLASEHRALLHEVLLDQPTVVLPIVRKPFLYIADWDDLSAVRIPVWMESLVVAAAPRVEDRLASLRCGLALVRMVASKPTTHNRVNAGIWQSLLLDALLDGIALPHPAYSNDLPGDAIEPLLTTLIDHRDLMPEADYFRKGDHVLVLDLLSNVQRGAPHPEPDYLFDGRWPSRAETKALYALAIEYHDAVTAYLETPSMERDFRDINGEVWLDRYAGPERRRGDGLIARLLGWLFGPPSNARRQRAFTVLQFQGAYVRRILESDALLEGAIAALAIEGYRRDHQGAAPATLDEIVPEWCPIVPADPFASVPDTPLLYRIISDGSLLLYSLGPNGTDDGGRHRPNNQPGNGDFVILPRPTP